MISRNLHNVWYWEAEAAMAGELQTQSEHMCSLSQTHNY